MSWLVFSRWFYANFCHLFFDCVEPVIKRFSLVTLSYQSLLNPSSRIYVIYELTIHHNQHYFNTYTLDRLLSTKRKNKWPCFISGPYHPTLQSSKIIYPNIWTETTYNIYKFILIIFLTFIWTLQYQWAFLNLETTLTYKIQLWITWGTYLKPINVLIEIGATTKPATLTTNFHKHVGKATTYVWFWYGPPEIWNCTQGQFSGSMYYNKINVVHTSQK